MRGLDALLSASVPKPCFQTLLFANPHRCLRPDKVLPAAQQLVEARLGRAFVEPPPFDLGACYSDSSPTTPLIFVLSPGSDPAAALAQFSSERPSPTEVVSYRLCGAHAFEDSVTHNWRECP